MQFHLVKRDNLTLPSFEEKKDACEIIKYKNKKKAFAHKAFSSPSMHQYHLYIFPFKISQCFQSCRIYRRIV